MLKQPARGNSGVLSVACIDILDLIEAVERAETLLHASICIAGRFEPLKGRQAPPINDLIFIARRELGPVLEHLSRLETLEALSKGQQVGSQAEGELNDV